MSMFYFAHNGVDHANQAEATAHNSNTTLWMIAATLAVAAVILVVVRALNKAGRNAQTQEQDAEDE